MDPNVHPAVFVHLLPSLIPPGALRGGVAVVVDVLRATTVMVRALAAGCAAVVPCAEIDEAKSVAAGLPAGTALLAGERGGLPIDGFDLGNSPEDFTPEVCRGKTLVTTTTNGTRAILACLEAERVYIASFTNLRATADELAVQCFKKDHGRPIHIVCSGTEGFISLEDSLLAGALTASIAKFTTEMAKSTFAPSAGVSRMGNDEAIMTAFQWLEAERYARDRPLWMLLSTGRGGENVERIGLARDIMAAAEIDRYDLVAELGRDPLRIEAV